MTRREVPEVVAAVKVLQCVGNASMRIKSCGIDFIPKEDWMSNTSDCAIMDFCVNGLFKWELFDRQPTTIDGLKRVATEVWHNLDQVKIQNAFKSWYGRVKTMMAMVAIKLSIF